MLWTALISSLLVLGVQPTESETTTPETVHLRRRTPSTVGSTVSLGLWQVKEMVSPELSSDGSSHHVRCTHNCTKRRITSLVVLSRSGDPGDHAIEDKVMTVIWAIGQLPGDYFHSPRSSLEAGEASNTNFYQPDEIKYHGGRNRGQANINFFCE